jgi:hypothetical protein
VVHAEGDKSFLFGVVDAEDKAIWKRAFEEAINYRQSHGPLYAGRSFITIPRKDGEQERERVPTRRKKQQSRNYAKTSQEGQEV